MPHSQLGGLSVVVNVVGNYLYKLTSTISTEEWNSILDSNLNGTFYITQAALPHLKAAKWGRIVNFASTGAHHVSACEKDAVYMIAKTGILIYTKSIAQELAKDNITANVIAPGVAENSVGLEAVVPTIPMKRSGNSTRSEQCCLVFY